MSHAIIRTYLYKINVCTVFHLTTLLEYMFMCWGKSKIVIQPVTPIPLWAHNTVCSFIRLYGAAVLPPFPRCHIHSYLLYCAVLYMEIEPLWVPKSMDAEGWLYFPYTNTTHWYYLFMFSGLHLPPISIRIPRLDQKCL